ncbi:MAG: hypoxanthine/guanine phosphoribosyltransferase [Candidatus Methanomethylophilus sp.]|nr:hypoxanthine/guanine phosphoribosyltransferase [Methanomethylophilus sp.]MDD3232941.1 hypoxanthine/guanine phosphoribosyltransferase [Methanomethylophilus sp.]MDD4221566.1 hypoxanthine/guanine phosphoribosyltransferase [Methanomethylophilus sp.]MDD4668731.1 hypoxanthine/guanine phosphoribosyltransferase [Methanomethylophilus sp.]
MYNRLIASIEQSPVIDRNGYPYFVHPLTDGVPRMDPAVLGEVVDWMAGIGNFDCDVIAAPEAMGIPLAVALSLRLGIPYTVIRKKKYGLPGEIALTQQTGYSKSTMYIEGIRKGDRVVIVDDVVSTGGTMIALLKAFTEEIGAEIVDVIIPVDKGDGEKIVEKKTGIRVKSLIRVKIVDGKTVCTRC